MYYGLKGDLVSDLGVDRVIEISCLRSDRVDLEQAVELVERERLVIAMKSLDKDKHRLLDVKDKVLAISTEAFDLVRKDAVMSSHSLNTLASVRGFTTLDEDDVVLAGYFFHAEVVGHRLASDEGTSVVLSGKFLVHKRQLHHE